MDSKPSENWENPWMCWYCTKAHDPLDCTQSLSFLLVLERLERTRWAAARETGVSKVDGRAQLLTRKERDCVQSNDSQTPRAAARGLSGWTELQLLHQRVSKTRVPWRGDSQRSKIQAAMANKWVCSFTIYTEWTTGAGQEQCNYHFDKYMTKMLIIMLTIILCPHKAY